MGPYTNRNTDVGVVLDLMIHDIDIVMSIVKSKVTKISSFGYPVFSRQEDIANAQILFENGCIANLTASRITRKKFAVWKSPKSMLLFPSIIWSKS